MKPISTLIIFCIVACANMTHAQYVLTLRCEEMGLYIGKSFLVLVTESGTGDEVGRKTISSVQADSFDIELYVLLPGKEYYVAFAVDVNGDNSYESFPVEPSWLRIVSNPSGPILINFIPDNDYQPFYFPNHYQYGQHEAIWGGKWMNLTFGSTDSIKATVEIACDSLFVSFSTAGVFGNPDTVRFQSAEERRQDFNPVSDTLHFSIDAPWTGEIYSINGDLHGNLTLMDIGLQFYGTLGRHQLLCHYTVTSSGSPLANGYFYLKELDVITNIPPLAIELVGTPVMCHEGADGSIWSDVSGGTLDYNYLWTPTGTTLPHLEGIPAGTYTLLVTDSAGCSAEASYILDDPESITIDVYITNESCPGACDATIELEAHGEHPPYTFSIEGDSCTGFMTIFVTDAIGCKDSVEVFIGTDSDLIVYNLITTHATNGQANGSVEVFVTGGIGAYIYSLDGGVYQSSNFFTNLPPGAYCITIQDDFGCSIKTDTFFINNLTAIHEIFRGLIVYPNPATSKLFVSCDELVSLNLLDLNGTDLKQSPPSNTHEVGVEEFPRGMYLLRLSGAFGQDFYKLILD